MTNKTAFDNLEIQLAKYETEIQKYIIDPKEHVEATPTIEDSPSRKRLVRSEDDLKEPQRKRFDTILAFDEPDVEEEWPKICLWRYMNSEELEAFLNLEKKHDIRKRIDSKLAGKHPRGLPRTVFRELMYSVTKFCKRMTFNVEQSGHVLSNFYLTHKFFTSHLERSAEKVYMYFKEFLLCHCLPYPPESIKIFSHQEAKEIMIYFCKVYLRNLPLIKFLSLPNFALYVDYIPEEIVLPKAKADKKGKKGKKGKGGKKGKKGKKK